MGEQGWRRAGAGVVVAACAVAAATIATMEPSAGAATPQARATLTDVNGNVVGEVVFSGHGSHTDQVEIDISGATSNPGAFHGFHVHAVGSCATTFPAGLPPVTFGGAGGHWNPTGATHGSHAGDLPSVLLTSDGESHSTVESDRFDVAALVDAAGDGSAVILHIGPDNFANIPGAYGAPNAATLSTGDAGGRYACGVISAV